MHSGWGALVAVSARVSQLEVIERRRILTIDPKMLGAKQPYHHVAQLELTEAERYLGECVRISQALARDALRGVMQDLDRRQYRLTGAALLLASGRALPSLPDILASHSLIHAAEGEFFRQAIRDACCHLAIPLTGYPERELEERAKATFGGTTGQVQRTIASLGKSLGPPWTKDEKTATLAAALLLGDRTGPTRSGKGTRYAAPSPG